MTLQKITIEMSNPNDELTILISKINVFMRRKVKCYLDAKITTLTNSDYQRDNQTLLFIVTRFVIEKWKRQWHNWWISQSNILFNWFLLFQANLFRISNQKKLSKTRMSFSTAIFRIWMSFTLKALWARW